MDTVLRPVLRLLIVLFLGFFASPAWAAPAFVQSVDHLDTLSTNTATWNTSGVAGNVVAAAIWWADSGITLNSVTIGGVAATVLDNPTVRGAMAYRFNIPASSSLTIVATFSGAIGSVVVAHEISGCTTTDPLDGHVMNNQAAPGTATDAVTSTSITTTANGDYIFGASADMSDNGNIQAGTNYTLRVNFTAGGHFQETTEERIQASAGSVAATFTDVTSLSDPNITGIMAFKAAGGAVVVPLRMLLGVGQ